MWFQEGNNLLLNMILLRHGGKSVDEHTDTQKRLR
jgi:hypothetical protein